MVNISTLSNSQLSALFEAKSQHDSKLKVEIDEMETFITGANEDIDYLYKLVEKLDSHKISLVMNLDSVTEDLMELESEIDFRIRNDVHIYTQSELEAVGQLVLF